MFTQKVLPVAGNMKRFEKLLKSNTDYIVVMDVHLALLKVMMEQANKRNKKILLHIDFVHGLSNDAAGVEYICQEFKPYGILSTKSNAILKAKQRGVLAIQRVFLLDGTAVEKNIKLVEKNQPDMVELLPGKMPDVISEMKGRLQVPVLAGGFIRTKEDVEQAIEAGAEAVTTSNVKLVELFY